MPVMLILYFTKTQSFARDKSSFTLQLIKGKSSDLQKLLQYLNATVAFKFKISTGGHAGRSASLSFTGCGGLSSVYPVIFVSYLNNQPSEASLLTLSTSSL